MENDNSVQYRLRLYITGASPNSVRAVSNLKTICEAYLSGRYELEIIDVYQQPALAKKDQVIALPLLIKFSPAPLKRLIGSMSDTESVLRGLELNKLNT